MHEINLDSNRVGVWYLASNALADDERVKILRLDTRRRTGCRTDIVGCGLWVCLGFHPYSVCVCGCVPAVFGLCFSLLGTAVHLFDINKNEILQQTKAAHGSHLVGIKALPSVRAVPGKMCAQRTTIICVLALDTDQQCIRHPNLVPHSP